MNFYSYSRKSNALASSIVPLEIIPLPFQRKHSGPYREAMEPKTHLCTSLVGPRAHLTVLDIYCPVSCYTWWSKASRQGCFIFWIMISLFSGFARRKGVPDDYHQISHFPGCHLGHSTVQRSQSQSQNRKWSQHIG